MSSMKRVLMKRIILPLFGIIALLLFFYGLPDAKVAGPCANCHTMHNSQNGANIARTGAGTGWNGSSQLAGGSIQGPQGQLLVTDCVGCHSSTTSQTIISVGGSRIPIVFNTAGYPAQPLAAGNFYYLSQGAAYDSYGHNVYGISNVDSRLTKAPGRGTNCAGGGFPYSCHTTLASNQNNGINNGGCQGCHVTVSHHTDNGMYRFLSAGGHVGVDDYVTGVEDPNWEQNPVSGHNRYKGAAEISPAFYKEGDSAISTNHSITAYCAGCHGMFHGPWQNKGGLGPPVIYGMINQAGNAWIRHPTDIALPTTGEYSAYNPVASYNATVPVAWVDPNTPSGPVVMCLSCHRAHASQYPSMLRWDYSLMIAGSTGAQGTGCFVCHSQKAS